MSMLSSLYRVRTASKLWPGKIYPGEKKKDVVGPATVLIPLACPQIIINFL